MASFFRESQNSSQKNGNDDAMRNNTKGTDDKDNFSLIVDKLHRELHRYLDLNSPPLESTLFNDVPCRPPSQYINDKEVGVKYPLTETKKRCLMEIAMTQEEKSNNLDFDLNLPPKMNSQDQSSNKFKISSSLNQKSCLSLEMNLIESSYRTSINEAPSLILMGCKRCLVYVMVSEIDPKCPKCASPILIDMFRGNMAKRSRKN